MAVKFASAYSVKNICTVYTNINSFVVNVQAQMLVRKKDNVVLLCYRLQVV